MSKPADKKLPDIFQAFVRECREEIEPVIKQFDLHDPEVVSHPPGCAVRYRGASIQLTINYEYGSRPWATLEVALQSGWKQFSLDRLMKSMCPDLVRKAPGAAESEEAVRLQGVKAISEFIPEIAPVFRGDVSLLKR